MNPCKSMCLYGCDHDALAEMSINHIGWVAMSQSPEPNSNKATINITTSIIERVFFPSEAANELCGHHLHFHLLHNTVILLNNDTFPNWANRGRSVPGLLANWNSWCGIIHENSCCSYELYCSLLCKYNPDHIYSYFGWFILSEKLQLLLAQNFQTWRKHNFSM